MTRSEKLDFLIDFFVRESNQINKPYNCVSEAEKKALLRSLMNLRAPEAVPEEVLTIQNEYLREEVSEKGIVRIEDIPTVDTEYGSTVKFAHKISLWQGDITRLKADAIVNAANSQMLGCFIPLHNCIDNCIHSLAGVQLRGECDKYMREQKRIFGPDYKEPIGRAVLTDAYNLPCRYIIHTVGPIAEHKLTDDLKKALSSCYTSVLRCCESKRLKSVAFCCISTGVFHFPNDEAAKIAVDTVTDYLCKNETGLERIIFNVFKDIDKESYKALL